MLGQQFGRLAQPQSFDDIVRRHSRDLFDLFEHHCAAHVHFLCKKLHLQIAVRHIGHNYVAELFHKPVFLLIVTRDCKKRTFAERFPQNAPFLYNTSSHSLQIGDFYRFADIHVGTALNALKPLLIIGDAG